LDVFMFLHSSACSGVATIVLDAAFFDILMSTQRSSHLESLLSLIGATTLRSALPPLNAATLESLFSSQFPVRLEFSTLTLDCVYADMSLLSHIHSRLSVFMSAPARSHADAPLSVFDLLHPRPLVLLHSFTRTELPPPVSSFVSAETILSPKASA
jgi:hypothetical protein